MGTMDWVAFALGVLAVCSAVFILSSMRRQRTSTLIMPANPNLDTGSLIVGLQPNDDHIVWTLTPSAGDDVVTVDVFSQRTRLGDRYSDWRHELLDEPLVLHPGKFAQITTVMRGDSHGAAIGWYVGPSAQLKRDSRFVDLQQPDDTA
jgi:hypothetical protein